MALKELLIKHEGLKLKPYRCTAGKLTIGVGRNLEDVGITRDEAMLLLENDIERTIKECITFPWFEGLDQVRQDVVASMVFNLGLSRFLGFVNTIDAISKGYYAKAALEMLKSRWAEQVGNRAVELAVMMRTGRRFE